MSFISYIGVMVSALLIADLVIPALLRRDDRGSFIVEILREDESIRNAVDGLKKGAAGARAALVKSATDAIGVIASVTVLAVIFVVIINLFRWMYQFFF